MNIWVSEWVSNRGKERGRVSFHHTMHLYSFRGLKATFKCKLFCTIIFVPVYVGTFAHLLATIFCYGGSFTASQVTKCQSSRPNFIRRFTTLLDIDLKHGVWPRRSLYFKSNVFCVIPHWLLLLIWYDCCFRVQEASSLHLLILDDVLISRLQRLGAHCLPLIPTQSLGIPVAQANHELSRCKLPNKLLLYLRS